MNSYVAIHVLLHKMPRQGIEIRFPSRNVTSYHDRMNRYSDKLRRIRTVQGELKYKKRAHATRGIGVVQSPKTNCRLRNFFSIRLFAKRIMGEEKFGFIVVQQSHKWIGWVRSEKTFMESLPLHIIYLRGTKKYNGVE